MLDKCIHYSKTRIRLIWKYIRGSKTTREGDRNYYIVTFFILDCLVCLSVPVN